MHKKKNAFTLIELMVAMGIIGVLVTLSLLGITIVQRSLRDTQRRDSVNAVRLAVEGHYTNNSVYPDIEIQVGGNAMLVGNEEVELNGPGKACPSGTSVADAQSDSSCSIYCYDTDGNTYSLGVMVEGGTITQVGNSGDDCSLTTPNDRVPYE